MVDYSTKTKDELIELLKLRDKTIKENKKYGLVWDDEKIPEKVVEDCKNNLPVLELVNDKTLSLNTNNKDTINHLLIEGDNYHTLNCLNYTHKNNIDLIYIDPPYNTGNKDFIYNDTFVNKEDSYRHSKWLNFMYKRLKIAKNLLKDEGVIFISIDDNEQANLKLLCDNVFGEENFVCNFVRKNKSGSGHDSSQIAIEYDYVLCYAKNKNKLEFQKEKIDVENDKKYKYQDEYIDYRGKYYLRDLDYKGSYSTSMDYPLIMEDGTEIYPGGKFGKPNTWRWKKSKVDWGIENDFIVFKKVKDQWKAYIKQYQFVDNENKKRQREIPYRALIDFSNSEGSQELKELVEQDIFNFPKPSGLIKFFINLISNKSATILDFFCGSGTTAQAVLELNAEDGGNRKCIVCTNNENGICENVTYPRIKKVMEKLEMNNKENNKEKILNNKNNNFYYLKTALIPISLDLNNITDKEKIDFTLKADSLIQIKEDIFNDLYAKKYLYRIFTNNNYSKILSIYYSVNLNEFDDMLNFLKEQILKNKNIKELIFYIFSINALDKESYNYVINYFKDYEEIKVRIEDIPEPVLEVYKLLNVVMNK